MEIIYACGRGKFFFTRYQFSPYIFVLGHFRLLPFQLALLFFSAVYLCLSLFFTHLFSAIDQVSTPTFIASYFIFTYKILSPVAFIVGFVQEQSRNSREIN